MAGPGHVIIVYEIKLYIYNEPRDKHPGLFLCMEFLMKRAPWNKGSLKCQVSFSTLKKRNCCVSENSFEMIKAKWVRYVIT